MTLGEKMQSLRKAAGLSQDQMAEALDVSRQSVSKWELDDSVPDLSRLVKAAELFSISLDELVLDKPPILQENTAHPSSALLKMARLNAASRLLSIGCITAAAGMILLIGELLFLPFLAQMHQNFVHAEGYYGEYIRYASMQPMPLVFFVTGALVVFGAGLIVAAVVQKCLANRAQ